MTVNLLDHPLIASRYFFPRFQAFPNPYMVQVAGCQLSCWRSGPPSDRPVLVHFHGNGELVSDWIQFFSQIGELCHFDIFLAEYRGYGMSTGQPALFSMLSDLDQIAEVVGVPAEKVVVFGRSVGSIYALEWVSRFPQTAGLVIESGIHDVYQRLRLRVLPEELGCSEEEFRSITEQYFDHTAKLTQYLKPSLFLHAQYDQIVTVDHAQRNAKAAVNSTLKIMNRGGHNDILYANSATYISTLKAFLMRCI